MFTRLRDLCALNTHVCNAMLKLNLKGGRVREVELLFEEMRRSFNPGYGSSPVCPPPDQHSYAIYLASQVQRAGEMGKSPGKRSSDEKVSEVTELLAEAVEQLNIEAVNAHVLNPAMDLLTKRGYPEAVSCSLNSRNPVFLKASK
jgi:pentatricopeptide repeat protein